MCWAGLWDTRVLEREKNHFRVLKSNFGTASPCCESTRKEQAAAAPAGSWLTQRDPSSPPQSGCEWESLKSTPMCCWHCCNHSVVSPGWMQLLPLPLWQFHLQGFWEPQITWRKGSPEDLGCRCHVWNERGAEKQLAQIPASSERNVTVLEGPTL